MKILFLTQVMPFPLDAGPKVRIYYVLRYLAQYHKVTLVSFTRGEKDERHVEHLRGFLDAVHTVPIKRAPVRDAYFLATSLVKGQPFLIARDHVDAMHETIRELTTRESFDAVHADQLGMAQYAVGLRGVKHVLDQHNAVWTIVRRMWQNEKAGPRKWLMQREWRVLQEYEARICRQFDHVLAVTEEDKRALQSLDSNGDLPITVMPICIDTDTAPRVERNGMVAPHIICIGGMFYPPNVDGVLWFAHEAFPHVKESCPQSDFIVVGARPDAALVRLAQEDPRVRVTGYVDDPLPLLRESAVFAVPIRAGGGMRVKIIDAWARGIPIVSTTIGCEGIQVRDGENILVADSPTDFANAVVRVIQDPALQQRLADNGRRWVQEQYDWRTVYKKLDAIYH